MITLYAAGSPNVRRVFIALEELELPYEFKPIDIWRGDQFQPGFLAVNPNSKVPAIIDSDGPDGQPITLFESAAIMIYLADKTGKLLPRAGAERYTALQWLVFNVAGVGPNSGQSVHFTRYAPPGNDYSKSRYVSELRRLYLVLEKRLSEASYLGGDEYGMADIALHPWARGRASFGITDKDHPNLAAWFDKIAARPAIARAEAKANSIVSSRETASEDALDRVFGRGKYARA